MDLFAHFAGLGVTALREGGFRITLPGFTTTVPTPDKVQSTIAGLPFDILMATAYLRVNLTYDAAAGTTAVAGLLQTGLMHCLPPIQIALAAAAEQAVLDLNISKSVYSTASSVDFPNISFAGGSFTIEGNTELGDPQNAVWEGSATLRLNDRGTQFSIPVLISCSLTIPPEEPQV